jgi:hypothetical protein
MLLNMCVDEEVFTTRALPSPDVEVPASRTGRRSIVK